MATECSFEPYLDTLLTANLFAGLGRKDLRALLPCLQATLKVCPAGGRILEAGDTVSNFGVVLCGSGRSIREDSEGRQVILTLLAPGSEIGVILAASRGHRSPVAIQAQTDMAVLSIPFSAMLTRCQKACEKHDRLLRNYLGIVAEKGLVLHEQIDCLLQPTVRQKVLTYLRRLSNASGSRCMELPLDRAAMAEYLNVDRSALSRELSRMRREGLIDFYKNSFKIL